MLLPELHLLLDVYQKKNADYRSPRIDSSALSALIRIPEFYYSLERTPD